MCFKILIALQCMKMEYQKIANLLDNPLNQPSKFRTRNWIEKMMNQEEHILVMMLNLKLQC